MPKKNVRAGAPHLEKCHSVVDGPECIDPRIAIVRPNNFRSIELLTGVMADSRDARYRGPIQ
jgi:hypothetical protein